jgi:hypothetical protein
MVGMKIPRNNRTQLAAALLMLLVCGLAVGASVCVCSLVGYALAVGMCSGLSAVCFYCAGHLLRGPDGRVPLGFNLAIGGAAFVMAVFAAVYSLRWSHHALAVQRPSASSAAWQWHLTGHIMQAAAGLSAFAAFIMLMLIGLWLIRSRPRMITHEAPW